MTLTPAYKAGLNFGFRTCPTCGEFVTMPNADRCGYCRFGKPLGYRTSAHSNHGFRYLPQPLSNLRVVRKRTGLSMRQLALESGVYLQTICSHELGERDVVRSDIAERLARALDVDVEELF